jgi:hypothetical protein
VDLLSGAVPVKIALLAPQHEAYCQVLFTRVIANVCLHAGETDVVRLWCEALLLAQLLLFLYCSAVCIGAKRTFSRCIVGLLKAAKDALVAALRPVLFASRVLLSIPSTQRTGLTTYGACSCSCIGQDAYTKIMLL